MKENKWYHKLLNIEPEEEVVNYKRKRVEVYELFKKNKFKKLPKNELGKH